MSETTPDHTNPPAMPEPDHLVCRPKLSMNPQSKVVMLQFELLDDLGELLGKSLNLAMTADDAMGLLWLLENIQKKHES